MKKRRLSLFVLASLLFSIFGAVVAASSASADDNADEWSMVTMVNQARTQAGLPALGVLGSLRDAARAQAGRMGASNTLAHDPNLAADITAAVNDWQTAGENVGQGWDMPGLHNAFMNSPHHRDNILGDYDYVGIGVVHAGGFSWIAEEFVKAPAGKVTIANTPPPHPVTRVGGGSPADTSVAVSQFTFTPGSARGVVVARDNDFADALAGGPLAGVLGGPVLLTPSSSV